MATFILGFGHLPTKKWAFAKSGFKMGVKICRKLIKNGVFLGAFSGHF